MLHITIIEDGETRMDMDTKGIIAAIDNGETTESVSCIHHLSAIDILELFHTLDKARAGLTKKIPALELLTLLTRSEEEPVKKESKLDHVAELLAEALGDEN